MQVLPTVRDGRKDIFIRADVPDVIRFEAAVDFVADLLGVDGAVEPKAVRRSRAVVDHTGTREVPLDEAA